MVSPLDKLREVQLERDMIRQNALNLAQLYNLMHEELCPQKSFCSAHRPGQAILDLPFDQLGQPDDQ